MTAIVYRTEVTHVRSVPLRNVFTYRSRWWLVDVDALPRVPWPLRPFLRFLPRDHLGSPRASLRRNVEEFLAEHGIDLDGGRITLLTAPRSLGHCFNPLSVFWCRRNDGTLAATLAEVHNTYGGRHVYLVRTPESGVGQVDKEFYVSPFYPVDGHYTMSLPEPGSGLALSVVLHRDGDPRPFVASVRGVGRRATRARMLTTVLGSPVDTLRTAALIRWQGVRLFLRGLPVVPRDTSSPPTVSPPQARRRPSTEHRFERSSR